jgi:hypothetical protein
LTRAATSTSDQWWILPFGLAGSSLISGIIWKLVKVPKDELLGSDGLASKVANTPVHELLGLNDLALAERGFAVFEFLTKGFDSGLGVFD